MMKNIWAILLGLFLNTSLMADFYQVSAVDVNATGDNSVLAKKEALEQGQKSAFNTLVRRLVGPDITLEADILDIVNMVQDMSIINEKNTADQYWGKIDVRFRHAEVQNYLTAHHQNILQNEPPRLLLLPVMIRGGYPVGLEDSNDFYQWVRHQESLSDFYQFVIPVGDVDEMVLVNQSLQSGQMSRLLPLAQRYGAEAVLLVEAENQPEDHWRLVSTWVGDKELKYQNLVVANWYGALSLSDAWQQLMNDMEQSWRVQDMETIAQDRVYYVRLSEPSLRRWVVDEEYLKKLDFLQDFTLQGTYHHQMLISFRFNGTTDELADHWRQNGWIWTPDLTGPTGTLTRQEVYYDR